MKSTALIILAASKIRQDYMSVFKTMPAMIPFNGKPLVYHIILNSINSGMEGPVVVALPESETHVEQFLRSAFGRRLDIHFCYISEAKPNCQADSLKQCLAYMKEQSIEDCGAIVANGDIYFELPSQAINVNYPIAFISNTPYSEKYSGFNYLDGELKFVPKGSIAESQNQSTKIDCGVYSLPSWSSVLSFGDTKNNYYQLSVGEFLVSIFGNQLQLEELSRWEDLGNLNSATKISTKVLGAREFNSLQIDEKKGLISKSSRKREKILQEINYYLKLPKQLSIYFPRLYDFNLGVNASYSIEYYPYKTLSEYFVMYELPMSCWESIFNKIFDIYSDFTVVRGERPNFEQYEGMYTKKLHTRMNMLQNNKVLSELVKADYVWINNKKYFGWSYYLPKIEKLVRRHFQTSECSVIHGDLCFSNILYEPTTNIIKFIDPRGEFYSEGVFGDPDYDLAKLMHSVLGGYDYILHQMYILDGSVESGFSFSLIQSHYAMQVKELFTKKLYQQYNLQKLDVLLVFEAMLFLSMLPLHSDDLKRQTAFYLTAVEILNSIESIN